MVVDGRLRERIAAFHSLTPAQLRCLPLRAGRQTPLSRDSDAAAVARFLATYAVGHVQLGRHHPDVGSGDAPNARPDYVYVTEVSALAQLGQFAEAACRKGVTRLQLRGEPAAGAAPPSCVAVEAFHTSECAARLALVHMVCWATDPNPAPAPKRRPSAHRGVPPPIPERVEYPPAADPTAPDFDWRSAFERLFGEQPPPSPPRRPPPAPDPELLSPPPRRDGTREVSPRRCASASEQPRGCSPPPKAPSPATRMSPPPLRWQAAPVPARPMPIPPPPQPGRPAAPAAPPPPRLVPGGADDDSNCGARWVHEKMVRV
eukprot:TRINITY_DN21852_c0_g1_i1.p1 TRINITY_DN21852_c0_g1~~TRINITY_DN21852_c0_g1_i1.p1  ORF type:complete len:342 (+),score=100.62 TRINITY_DN21852_c0_g1_i1:78-1028(+)